MGKRCACGALPREGAVICEKCIARAHWRSRVTQKRRRGSSGARPRRDQRHPQQVTQRSRKRR